MSHELAKNGHVTARERIVIYCSVGRAGFVPDPCPSIDRPTYHGDHASLGANFMATEQGLFKSQLGSYTLEVHIF